MNQFELFGVGRNSADQPFESLGQVLAFHKAVKGIAKNEALEVVSADRDGVTARKENGREVRTCLAA